PMTTTGQFNGNSQAENDWSRTGIIAKYGAYSCIASFLALAIIVGGRLVPSLNSYANLMNACAYAAVGLGTVVLLVMKIQLEGGYGKLLFGSTEGNENTSESKMGAGSWKGSE
ncbi:hypothetical protein HDU81_001062, partial [Chytriomyces hyalinus]